MKIFENENRVNFVDENNVFVGYNLYQQCCEEAGWFITPSKCTHPPTESPVPDVSTYVFDTSYFDENVEQMIILKLVSKDKPELYLHIYNYHNGFYAHGFQLMSGDKILKKSLL